MNDRKVFKEIRIVEQGFFFSSTETLLTQVSSSIFMSLQVAVINITLTEHLLWIRNGS